MNVTDEGPVGPFHTEPSDCVHVAVDWVHPSGQVFETPWSDCWETGVMDIRFTDDGIEFVQDG